MKEFIGSMPQDASPEYFELVRRQTAVGIPVSTPYAAREFLLRDGVGRHYVSDRPTPTKRPRKSILSNPTHYEPPAIVATPTSAPPVPRLRHMPPPAKRWWQIWS